MSRAKKLLDRMRGNPRDWRIEDVEAVGRMKAYRYEVDVKPLSDELGGGYIAIVPELPGCKSDGDTPHEALQNAYDAIACWIEAASEVGRPVPTTVPDAV